MDRTLLLIALAALLVSCRADGTTERDPRLTGNPQIDWEFDPNYPRELRGYNMTGYPFLSRPPPRIKFSCKDRIDGFYSNQEYKCQVYHHCLYGIRQDFLCANYTVFDMSTFICQFVNVVDCEGSDKFVYRNEPLYKFTTTVKPKRKRPFDEERRPPADDYYYDDYYDDYYYYDDPAPKTTTTTTTTTTRRPLRRRPGGGGRLRRPGGVRRRPQRRRRPQPVYDYPDYADSAPAADQETSKAAAPLDTAYPDYDYPEEPAPVRQQTRLRRPGGGGRVGGRRRPRPVAAVEETAPAEPEEAPARRPAQVVATAPVRRPAPPTRSPPPPAPVPEVAPAENEVLDAPPPARAPSRRRPVGGSRRGGLLTGRRPAPVQEPEPAREEAAAPPRRTLPGRRRRPQTTAAPTPAPEPEFDYYDDYYSDVSGESAASAASAPAAQEPPVYEDPAPAAAPAPAPVRRPSRGRGGRRRLSSRASAAAN